MPSLFQRVLRLSTVPATRAMYSWRRDLYLHLGADPDNHLTHGSEAGRDVHDSRWLRQLSKEKHEAIWHLLLNEGADPRWHEKNPLTSFRWQGYFDMDEESFARYQDIFGEISSSDNGDLSQLLEILCSHGRFTKLQEMRERAQTRVDAIICEKAALFLMELLDNLSPQGAHVFGGRSPRRCERHCLTGTCQERPVYTRHERHLRSNETPDSYVGMHNRRHTSGETNPGCKP